MHSLTKKYNLNREPSRRKDSALKAKKHLFMFSYGWMPFLIKSFKAFQISLHSSAKMHFCPHENKVTYTLGCASSLCKLNLMKAITYTTTMK